MKLQSKKLFFSILEYRTIWTKILEIEDNHQFNNQLNDNQLIYKLQEVSWKSLTVKKCIDQILNCSELEQYEDDSRLNLVIKASMIFLEKISLQKYCDHCKTKYQIIDKTEDAASFEYYLNEYIVSKQKILKLQFLQSLSQLEINSNKNNT